VTLSCILGKPADYVLFGRQAPIGYQALTLPMTWLLRRRGSAGQMPLIDGSRVRASRSSLGSAVGFGGCDDLGTQFLGLSVRSRLLARQGDISAARSRWPTRPTAWPERQMTRGTQATPLSISRKSCTWQTTVHMQVSWSPRPSSTTSVRKRPRTLCVLGASPPPGPPPAHQHPGDRTLQGQALGGSLLTAFIVTLLSWRPAPDLTPMPEPRQAGSAL
jgi:hypothetical protein